MIGYITLGTNNIDQAREFYDALLGEIGASRIVDNGHLTIWGQSANNGMLGLIKPFNGENATVGNGTMAAIPVASKDMVGKMHAKALALGGTDEGAPGPRGTRKTEFAYCRDPEGHKLAFFCMG
jgi:catechol 2,3-dioxygenase-like lactoylglutathione lyase family enzyme